MIATVLKRTTRLMTFAAAFAACAVLFAPTTALAAIVTVSGNVTVTGGAVTAAHPVEVTLWEMLTDRSDPADPIDYWSPTDYYTQSTNGSWTIPQVDDTKQYKVVFSDWPFNWYQETVYPGVPTVNGEPIGGTAITAGVGNPLNVTLTQLPKSFTGIVKDAVSLTPVADVWVTAYELDPIGWGDNIPVWFEEFYTETATDGTYELHGLTPGTGYRIGFKDVLANRSDVYYPAASSVTAATTRSAPAASAGAVDLGTTLMRNAVGVERIAPTGTNFWSQSVNVAKRQLGGDYSDIADIILVSGDTRAQADPLSAAGLAYAYQVTNIESNNLGINAPLLMVSGTKATDITVKNFIRDIAKGNGGKRLTIHIVGGKNSVPDARFNEIKAALAVAPSALAPVSHRVVTTGDRYALAAGIAKEMGVRASVSATDVVEPADFVLVANGADPAKFFDPLALSPIAAANGAPILLVSVSAVPASTTSAITSVFAASTSATPTIYVGGGVNTVSNTVLNKLAAMPDSNAVRVSGGNRYSNAVAIANKALAMGWLYDDGGMAIASTIADAQLGGVLAGNEAAPLLITPSTSLDGSVKTWLSDRKAILRHIYVVGSRTAVNDATYSAIVAAVK